MFLLAHFSLNQPTGHVRLLFDPPNPLEMKNLKKCSKNNFFKAQKKRLDALNATQKPQLLTKYGS